MARPKDEDRRQAILDAAEALVASEGLGASTAAIAKQAGVPHGSVFTYFATKNELLNALYLGLKRELIAEVLTGFKPDGDDRAAMEHLWAKWTAWGAASPRKRRTLAQLAVSDVVTQATRDLAEQESCPITEVIWRVSQKGALAGQPMPFVGAVVESIAETTMDFMIREPTAADSYAKSGFESLWRAIA